MSLRAPTDRPNIILVNCDDLGYGDLGCYGSEMNPTPAIDRMAAEGLRLTDFYMASPVCSPSRGGMMTGCYPKRIGFDKFSAGWVLFPGNPDGLNPSEITMARLLKGQGYATKIVGKWHCGDQPEFLPTRHGFDSYFGLPYSNDMGRQARRRGWKAPPLPLLQDETVIQQQPDQTSLTERYVEKSLEFIRTHRAEPFFLYLAHMHVHIPHYPPERFLKTSWNGRYGAAVQTVDWSMAAIFHELRAQGLDQNTLVIFTSDNGSRGDRGGSNYPLRGNKGTTYEGGQRVPCIVWWPGVVPAGTASDQIVSSIDFLPTFTALAGGQVPTDRIIDGRDCSGHFRDPANTASPRETFFYYKMNCLQAVRHKQWKLRVFDNGPIEELYNLAEDIGESRNVAADNPDVVAKLRALADACREDLGDDATGTAGANCRPVGMVENPKPLTEYDPEHPYIYAMYDLPDAG